VAESKLYPPPRPTTPRLAPWDHVEVLCDKLNRLIALLEGVAPAPPAPPPEWPGWEPIISKLDEIKSQLTELGITVTTTWEAKEPEEIYREAIRTIGTFHSGLVDWKKGKRLILKVKNTLDQQVTIQPIGNIRHATDGAVDISVGPLPPCAPGGYISVGLAWDDWHPFVGCDITTVAPAPTSGMLMVEAVVQE